MKNEGNNKNESMWNIKLLISTLNEVDIERGSYLGNHFIDYYGSVKILLGEAKPQFP